MQHSTPERDGDQSATAFPLPHPIAMPSQPIAMNPERTTVGRSPYSTIAISSAAVSRRHAVIIRHEGNYYVKDMETRNGTFINGNKITVSRLDHGDQITFGDQCFLFLRQSGIRKAFRWTNAR